MRTPPYVYRVIECLKVYDGDSYTLRVDVGFHLYTVIKVRLLGADTFELRGGDEETKEKARAGKNFAENWFWARLEADPRPVLIRTQKTDNFGRWLGEIWDDETSLHLDLIEAGLTTGRYE